MTFRLPVSSFAQARLVPLDEVHFTPFMRSDTPAKMDWASSQIGLLYSPEDIIEIPINQRGCPSIATYTNWLQRALKETYRGDTKAISTRVDHSKNLLYVRLVERKEQRNRKGKVSHVIH